MEQSMVEIITITTLNYLFKKNHFDICIIDSVANVLCIQPKREEYILLHALHCIEYGQMPQKLLDSLPTLVRDCLSFPPAYQFDSLKMKVVGIPIKQGLLCLIGMRKGE
jgi:hypothetical protein